MRTLSYRGVGTVEFLYEGGEFYFIEMNTRLQVEHTITEMITGLDLVIEQIRIAAGAPLTLRQEEIRFNGHAIECRINAENPHTFRPSPGTITHFHPPGGLGVRVDSGAYAGYTIPPYYDSLIGKLIVHARTRNECLMRLKRALGEFVVDGIETTIPLFTSLISEPDIVDGNYDIHWLENHLAKAGHAAGRSQMTSIDDVMIEITPQVLLKAYACGIFPMAESAEDNALYWIEPERRGILPLDRVHVPKRLARTIRNGGFEVKVDNGFRGGDRRLRRAPLRPAQHLDQRAYQEPLSRTVRARPLPYGRGMAGRRARRRALRRASRPRLFRREHVLAECGTRARSLSSI